MARELPEDRRALPVLKVLYRNTNRIQEHGGSALEVLHTVKPGVLSAGHDPAARCSATPCAARTWTRPSGTFAAIAGRLARRGLQQPALRRPGRHRGPPRRPPLPRLGPARRHRQGAGPHAAPPVGPLLREERARREAHRRGRPSPAPSCRKLLDQYHLAADIPRHEAARTTPGSRDEQDDLRVEPASGRRGRGRGAGRGDRPERRRRGDLAGRESARPPRRRPPERGPQPGKPPGSVHGDSIGVHACDSANAWRNMARVGNPRNAVACLILGGLPGRPRPRRTAAATSSTGRPRPLRRVLEAVKTTDPKGLLAETEAAIRANQQALASRARPPLRQARPPTPRRSSTCCSATP